MFNVESGSYHVNDQLQLTTELVYSAVHLSHFLFAGRLVMSHGMSDLL